MLQIRINHIIISNAGFGVIVQGMDLLVCGFYSKEQTFLFPLLFWEEKEVDSKGFEDMPIFFTHFSF